MLLVVSLIAAPSFAQWGDEKTGIVAVSGGFASPSSDDFDLVADRNLAITGYVARKLTGPIGWRIEGSFNKFSIDEDFASVCPTCDDPTVKQLGGGLQLGGLSDAEISPYTSFTVGGFSWDPGIPSVDSDTSLGISFASGVNWAVSETWGIGVEFKINGFFPDETVAANNQWFTQTNFQAFFRF